MKIIGKIWILFLLGFILCVVYNPDLPEKNEISPAIINNEPAQSKIEIESISKKAGEFDYKIHPIYSYDLYGLVVSKHDSESWFDFAHKKDPANIRDLCVVWGSNIKSGVYREVNYKSGEFTCFYEWFHDLDQPFDGHSISNNHLLPKDDLIANKIKKADVGDQIHLQGYLASYEVFENDQKIGQRGTSITREDTASGACETIYVTSFEIIKKDNIWLLNLKKIFLWGLIFISIIGIINFFIEANRGVK